MTDLNCDPLIVLIHGLRHVDFKGAVGLTLGTSSRFHFFILVLEERPQNKAALGTLVLDHAELRHDAGSARDHPGCTDQLV